MRPLYQVYLDENFYNGVGTKIAQDVGTNVFDPSDIYLLDDDFRVKSRFLEHPDILFKPNIFL